MESFTDVPLTTPAGTPFGYSDAERLRIQNDQRKIARAIANERAKLDRMAARVKKQKARFEKLVALSISSAPHREDWYVHAGPMPREQVRVAAGLTNVAVHRLMERYRKSLDAQRRRSRGGSAHRDRKPPAR